MRLHFPIILAAATLAAVTQSGCRRHTNGENQNSVKSIIIPQPVEIKFLNGNYKFTKNLPIFFSEDLRETALIASEQLGFKTELCTGRHRNGIYLKIDTALPQEGYRLQIGRKRIDITGSSATGVFYGLQTLRQLTEINENNSKIPCVEIEDWPRFRWRGLMLDCSRTFQSIDYIKKTIDRLSFYKMNILHLHLTDDQGWRMEIKSHPELTTTGSRFHPYYNEPERYQGYYTQEQLKDLVRYAESRGITIVPEIEMPGHCYALLVCYPELSCTGKIDPKIFPYFKGPGVTKDILCAGNERVFSLIQDVINEVIDVFPSRFIHIGGDEAPKDRWENCRKCQARIKEEGLKDEKELQSYFVSRVEKMISAKGRRLIGWSEIIEGGLTPDAAVMDWIGGAKVAAGAGQDVVMSPTGYCYFDYTYKAISTEHAYSFDPVSGLWEEQAKYVLGLQANFWSHIDREPELVDKQLFPRLLSIAERGWSEANTRDWDQFSTKISKHLKVLQKMGVCYNTTENRNN